MNEIIEGEAVEIEPIRAVVVAQQGQNIVTPDGFDGPDQMLAKATHIATALARMVEAQKLYSVIQGRKFPQVEAWMTIGRMDNVVARESRPPVRHDDGAYEAFVDLIRLSDGMVVGSASALCGSPDDAPWGGMPARNGKPASPPRAEHQRRSMAVTRATSRAFRQQYSWIMALAGYEVTPAEEMPVAEAAPIRVEPDTTTHDGGLIGTVMKGKPPVDLELRQTPDGAAWGFKLAQGQRGFQALALGPLAEALSLVGLEVGTRVIVWGTVHDVAWEKDGKAMPPYKRIAIERVQSPDWTLPAPAGATETPAEPVEAPSIPLPLDEDERAAVGGGLPG